VRHPRAWAAASTRPRDADLVDQDDQLLGVGGLPGGEPGGQVAAAAVADGVQLGGQPTA